MNVWQPLYLEMEQMRADYSSGDMASAAKVNPLFAAGMHHHNMQSQSSSHAPILPGMDSAKMSQFQAIAPAPPTHITIDPASFSLAFGIAPANAHNNNHNTNPAPGAFNPAALSGWQQQDIQNALAAVSMNLHQSQTAGQGLAAAPAGISFPLQSLFASSGLGSPPSSTSPFGPSGGGGTSSHGEKRSAEDIGMLGYENFAKAQKLDWNMSNMSSSGSLCGDAPPQVKDEAELAKMTPAERRRYERNLREQQRSYRISQQIKELRDVLVENSIPYKPNKFAILMSVVDYIKQLQSRAIMLDAEHQKLIATINLTTEIIASGSAPATVSDSSDKDSYSPLPQGVSDEDMVMVRGINYESLLENCPVGMGVASLDGRVLACNPALEKLFGSSSSEMEQQSLFLFVRNHQDVFEAMADLLKRSSGASDTGVEGTLKAPELLYWCGSVYNQSMQRVSPCGVPRIVMKGFVNRNVLTR